MNSKLDGKHILVSSTDVMMIQFLIPHIIYLSENGAIVDVACSSANEYKKDGYAEKIQSQLPEKSTFYYISTERSPYSLKNFKGYKELKNIIKQSKYDLIWTNEPVMGVITRLAANRCRKKGGKVLYMVHGYHFFQGAPIKNWIYYPVEKIMSHFCDAIVVINWDDYKFTKKHFKVPVFHIDGVGLDVDKFANTSIDREKKRNQLNIKEDDCLVLSVGELKEHKNHQVIIKAIANLKNEKIKYIICGKGELEENLKALVRKNNLDGQVYFLGHRYDINEILCASDIFAHPSQREGLGIAAIEAMSAGLPMITSNVGGIKDYIINGENGYMYEPNDVNGFASGIHRLVEDIDLRKKMGNHNKQCAEKYSIEKSEAAVKDIIEGLVKK